LVAASRRFMYYNDNPMAMMSGEPIKIKFRRILSVNEPPRRISLAFSIGIFIAFSPAIGFHTVSALAAARLFKLNSVVVLAGSVVSNPLTFVFIYGSSFCFGNYILGNRISCFPHTYGQEGLLAFLKAMPIPFLAGTLVLGLISALISYIVLFQVLISFKNVNRQ